LLLGAAAASALPSVWAQPKPTAAWSQIEKAARGQTVYFNAWAGSDKINAYLQWVVAEMKAQHGVNLEHVKISDGADVVKRVRAEKAAGRDANDGTVDLAWINGENFAAMKREGLLFGPFAETLPSFDYVDVAGKPTTINDFSVPTEGMESPWGMAQFTLYADSKRLTQLPQNTTELLALARSQPGRISYPRLPDFTGTTFVKQALIEHVADVSVLTQAPSETVFKQQTEGLWKFLDALHPHLWRGGKQFPQTPSAVRQMMADGELLLALTFNPNEPANEIASKRLSPSVVSWQFAKGTIGNTHFVAIPYNAKAKAGAQVTANFLLSAKAQARKADIKHWGDPTVLDLNRLPAAERALFPAKPLPGQVVKTAPTLPEPHAGWVDPLEREWTRRYA
jgi:putative thiamine transport system substrate-binding protein